MTMRFRDRRDAGRHLARALESYEGENPLVLALPRGGVPVGYEVAQALDAELDTIVARKLGAPTHPEFGVGAIAPGAQVIDERALRALGLTDADVARVEADERRELARRENRYRGERPFPPVEGRTVILVDDGLATGVTTRAAIQSVKRRNPAKLVLAVPVGPPDTVEDLRAQVDDVVVLLTPRQFQAVGLWYEEFGQTSDEEVLDLLERARRERAPPRAETVPVEIPVAEVTLRGDLGIPEGARGVVVFAHGSGSGRMSPRNRHVAQALREAGLGTLLLDLLTEEEEAVDLRTAHLRFDIDLLAERVAFVVDWLSRAPRARDLRMGIFGASTGAAAALVAAAERPDLVAAVVSRGGRPDLARARLDEVRSPTRLIVGGNDAPVIELNRTALARLNVEKDLVILPGASHLFEEPGKLEEVARLAGDWFLAHLGETRARVPEEAEGRQGP